MLEKVFNRSKSLNKENFVSDQELERAESNFLVAEAQFDKALIKFQQTKILAPYDGIIQNRFLDEGSIINASIPIIEILDSKYVEAKVSLPRSLVNSLDVGKVYKFLIDSEEYEAKLIGTDPVSDIAVLKIESKEKFKPVRFGDSDKARIGDWVIAIGNPFGLGGTVTSGIISARNRSIGLSRYEDYIQTDASINSGNSGGPLFDMNGDVIGINTAILGRSGNVGIGFSIPSNSAKIVIDQLIEFGETKRGWLGVRIQVVDQGIADAEKLDKPRGALVASVADNSPSDKGGIKPGDIILEFDGKPINEMKELPKIVAETDVGKKVIVKVWRNKREITKEIILGRQETSEDFKAQKPAIEKPKVKRIEGLKIDVRLLSKDDIDARNLPKGTSGVVITKIDKDSPINYLQVNNVIVEANRKKINTIGDLDNVVKLKLRSDENNLLIAIYNNQNQRTYIGVKLK